jgi:hypothetical protein
MNMGKALSILAVSLFGVSISLWAQQPTPLPPPAGKMEMAGKPGMMDEKKMDESMMAHHKEMTARMEAMDSRLDDLVKKMNAARGSKKVDAVAAVVSELVSQRKEMRQQMMTMQPEMMKHMMGHMMKGMEDSMSKCPMMKTMAPAKDGE